MGHGPSFSLPSKQASNYYYSFLRDLALASHAHAGFRSLLLACAGISILVPAPLPSSRRSNRGDQRGRTADRLLPRPRASWPAHTFDACVTVLTRRLRRHAPWILLQPPPDCTLPSRSRHDRELRRADQSSGHRSHFVTSRQANSSRPRKPKIALRSHAGESDFDHRRRLNLETFHPLRPCDRWSPLSLKIAGPALGDTVDFWLQTIRSVSCHQRTQLNSIPAACPGPQPRWLFWKAFYSDIDGITELL